jgi:hypothetical protein
VTNGAPWAPPKLPTNAADVTKLEPPPPPAPFEPPKHPLVLLQISLPEAPPPPPK